ncbi:MAG TPA: hypothetical protein VGH42_12740 [Verrucomicrobiae bacterium]|jgi:hypothetical protein
MTGEAMSRKEAFKRLHGFAAELKAMEQRNNSEWIFNLWIVVSLLIGTASKKNPDPIEMEVLRNELANCIKRQEFLKGLDFAIQCADVLCQRKPSVTVCKNYWLNSHRNMLN